MVDHKMEMLAFYFIMVAILFHTFFYRISKNLFTYT